MYVSRHEHSSGESRRSWLPARQRSRTLLSSAALVLAAGMLLTLIGASRSEQTTRMTTVKVRHNGAFGYSATVPADSVYGTTSVSTGEPVFTQFVKTLDLSFTDRVSAPLHGTASLDATLSDISTGWSRSIPVVSPTAVSGMSIAITGPLDLDAVKALSADFLKQTQSRSASFRITLSARVALSGQQEGIPVSTVFEPRVTMKFDAVSLSPPAPPNSSPSVANADRPVDPFAVTRSEDARGPRPADGSLSMLGMASIPVAGIRFAGVLALIAGLVLVTVGLIVHFVSDGEDEVTEIRRRFSDILVPSLTHPSTPTTVQVATIEDLARLARRFESAIVHAESGSRHTFSVYDGAVTYRYELVPAAPAAIVTGNGSLHSSDQDGRGFERRGPEQN